MTTRRQRLEELVVRLPRRRRATIALCFAAASCLTLATLATTPAGSGAAKPLLPPPHEGVSAILAAFSEHEFVALGESHGSVAEHALIGRLIERREFASKVGAIVVEFGNTRFQGVIDAYVSGKASNRRRVVEALGETTQREGVWTQPVYIRFFDLVRRANLRLPERVRVRVLLGDPPIDWTKIDRTCADPPNDWKRPRCLDYWFQHQSETFARVALAGSQGPRRVLMIAGSAHFEHMHDRTPTSSATDTVTRIERGHRGSVFVITTFEGFPTAPSVASKVNTWPVGSVGLLKGSKLGDMTVRKLFGPPPPPAPGNIAGPDTTGQLYGARYDALLYHGPPRR